VVTIQADPANPERLILTQTATLYLDRVLLETLSAEVADSIRAQAIKDLKSSKAVKKAIADAATKKLLTMLGVPEIAPSQAPQVESGPTPLAT
jgi:hypothetical protein